MGETGSRGPDDEDTVRQSPSFAKFDGGASARYQPTHEITSFGYPVWLAYPVGLVQDSRLFERSAQAHEICCDDDTTHGLKRQWPIPLLSRSSRQNSTVRWTRQQGARGNFPSTIHMPSLSQPWPVYAHRPLTAFSGPMRQASAAPHASSARSA